MTLTLDLTSDLHTHSSLTDGADTAAAMADAALAAGLRTWGLSDHVRADTTWLPDYVRTVHALDVGELVIRCGVEAKILDQAGALDLPPGSPALDYILIADHQFPGRSGPVHPTEIGGQLADGSLTPSAALEALITATCAAVRTSPAPPIVAHLFSVLPKCGLTEDQVDGELIDALAKDCVAAEARVEVNEKWRCPSLRVIDRLSNAGVVIVAGSDAHRCADIGRWDYATSLDRSAGP
ncbi:MAG: PHP domain-containing protein [Jatrophihabitans sp.]